MSQFKDVFLRNPAAAKACSLVLNVAALSLFAGASYFLIKKPGFLSDATYSVMSAVVPVLAGNAAAISHSVNETPQSKKGSVPQSKNSSTTKHKKRRGSLEAGLVPAGPGPWGE